MSKFLPRTSNNIKGFTLVELLVVISIIAFLSVIGVTAFSNAQKTARDGRRRADVDAIAKAVESLYNPVTGVYTGAALTDAAMGTSFASGKIPTDPGSTSYTLTYVTTSSIANSGFWVCATLENTTQGNASAIGDGATYPTYTSGTYYCKSSQQGK